MRAVFCGTPQFAVPSLRALLACGHDVALVLAQPDRPAGRKQILTAPAVKQAALETGISVLQPEKLRHNAELQARLAAVAPEVIVVVAYGRIIPPWMLALPPRGNINVHASLLPRYRGAAPIQWALANGEAETGVTTMLLDEGLDTGPILQQKQLQIGEDETAVELSTRLAESGAELLVSTLNAMAAGKLKPHPQDAALATHAPILQREDGRVDFEFPARALYNRWRGFQPWPGLFAFLGQEKIALSKVRPVPQNAAGAPGTLEFSSGRVLVACGQASMLELVTVQPAGGCVMAAADFVRGRRLGGDARLT